MTENRVKRPKGHGWGAYFWPYVSFGAIAQFGTGLPESLQPVVLPLKVIVPLGLMVYYFSRGHYPELRGYPFGARGVLLDFAMGVVGAALWMAPYLFFDSLRPDDAGFDANQWGESLAPIVLAIRCIGYGVVTPLWEELLIRSWLIRYIEVFNKPGDFRDVPIGHYGKTSFWVVVVFFSLSHMPWEYLVAVPWIVLSLLWFYYRKNLMSLVLQHAGSNLTIFFFVLFQTGRWLDADGNPLSLWFFI